ncbi:PAS/PAC domain [Clostridium sp. SY8519]|uniref:hypothetical protein n=1 Tax=Clostridium sp. (strain SY8519) TaxID=1042156 RepID=UPI00021722AD|nr:hypothetical protein [Clostridium sp. SY8519]BAK48475.1 PAS/PAC domain [Clostridium sp. SY8519]
MVDYREILRLKSLNYSNVNIASCVHILAMCTPVYVGGNSKREKMASDHYQDLKEIFGKEEPSNGND